MTSMELMVAAFNKLSRKKAEVYISKCQEDNYFVLEMPSYESEDFLFDITKDLKFIDNAQSMEKCHHHTAQIDITLSDGSEIEVCYAKSSDDHEMILLAKDIECLCFLVVHEDINKAIEKYGARAVRLIPYGL